MKAIPVMTWALTAALIVLPMGCTAAGSGVDALPSPTPDTAAPAGPDVLQPTPEASVDRPSSPDADPADLPGELEADARTDAPSDLYGPSTPWPPPGTSYLTRLATEADYNQLADQGSRKDVVSFIIRRLSSDHLYPYPWDSYECVFEPGASIHIDFLQGLDPDRALFLYYGEAKRPEGTLIPGRIRFDKTKTPNVATVGFENTRNLIGSPFPLDPAVFPILRERIKRCAPFATNFTFLMICPDGKGCPLP
ncbi:MAG TPA: hypothetical protein VFH73_09100 [Polyangia bacterium]|jgi:hypothetical protein|nr:hypothetical protein [Polyangia bacterium]